jgi:hypothetical protein
MQSALYNAVKESIEAELKEDTQTEDLSDTFEVNQKFMCAAIQIYSFWVLCKRYIH